MLRNTEILSRSQMLVTTPVGNADQPDFLNAVVKISTEFNAQELLKELLAIERDMGRVRKEKWGPRIIDLDILFFGTQVIKEDNLKVPHPELVHRRFNLGLMKEIAPDFIHPEVNKTMECLYGTD